MRINILYNLKKGAWGGGNQFLKALRGEFIKRGVYEENPELADVVLFNSFPSQEEYIFRKLRKMKKQGKKIVHRVDGPVFKIRGTDMKVDKFIYESNDLLADGTIFQSCWSRNENYRAGMKKNIFETVIINASDPKIFNIAERQFFNNKRIKIIATSWSSNMRKGFGVYKYLDENLDFSKYEMTFIGNSPINFKNIKKISPLNSFDLAAELKKNDIFITASQSDPCSNSLIEALSCGLPAVVLNDGGHPEIIKNGGEIFSGENDVLEKILKVSNNYEYYQKNIDINSLSEIAEKYFNFMENVFNNNNNKKIKYFFIKYYLMIWRVYAWKFVNFSKVILRKIFNFKKKLWKI